METVEILKILAQGEDSKNQFKKDFTNGDALAAELVAFSNTLGGKIFVGVDDDGEIVGLETEDIQRINQLLSNTASQNVKPAINPLTEISTIEKKRILIVEVAKGNNKPYQDKNGVIWVKSGADKRRATAREEIQRFFQESGMIHADITPANMTIADLDMPYFTSFFQKRYGKSLENQQVSLEKLIMNLNLGKDGILNITGALLFSNTPEIRLPSYIVKAAAFPGTSIAREEYIDSRDITGKLSNIFQQAIGFLMDNTKHVQGEQGINSPGKPEIPKIVLEELVTNALVHRDYFISAPVRIFVFSDRIEIISPGHLPNNLTVENIKAGNSNTRNPVLASFAYQILPYRGFGSGILRALENYPDIEFIDDRYGNLFKCIVWRQSTPMIF
ncbi:putative transcriptional regulator [Desulfamplus magnetovallimortis]|uniref:Putative transcriptional regulator n=1 Tax=Desulfamplus magnetovallimortis TaxID=1246637 RepID=A0A1W1HIW8_9BACT|nr:RNA-binding domain-containing protein [Desulfamplus magnetovallimortis]SLM32467.1 putative transcriptional regulator [Desulfamplus magnetovallimortis]